MKKTIYFASEREVFPDADRLALGFGFTPAGGWREGNRQGAAGVVLDDRYPPADSGLASAVRALEDWEGLILCDFEQPPAPALSSLLRRWEGRPVIVPEAWAELPHQAVLLAPYGPGVGFRRWLSARQARYGAVMLDGAPMGFRVPPGGAPVPAPPPEDPNAGWDCPGALCRCRREGGALRFWDTRETLSRRCRAAGVPVVVLRREWEDLQP